MAVQVVLGHEGCLGGREGVVAIYLEPSVPEACGVPHAERVGDAYAAAVPLAVGTTRCGGSCRC